MYFPATRMKWIFRFATLDGENQMINTVKGFSYRDGRTSYGNELTCYPDLFPETFIEPIENL